MLCSIWRLGNNLILSPLTCFFSRICFLSLEGWVPFDLPTASFPRLLRALFALSSLCLAVAILPRTWHLSECPSITSWSAYVVKSQTVFVFISKLSFSVDRIHSLSFFVPSDGLCFSPMDLDLPYLLNSQCVWVKLYHFWLFVVSSMCFFFPFVWLCMGVGIATFMCFRFLMIAPGFTIYSFK